MPICVYPVSKILVMRFARYLHKKLIFLDLSCSSKEEAIEYLTQVLCDYYKLPYKKEILHDVMEREKIKSTGLGKGLAVPHGRTDLVDKLYVVFARTDKGIDWTSVDNKPAQYIFFIVNPLRLEKEYLETLGDISRIMMRYSVREGIRTAKKPQEVIDVIEKSGVRHKKRT